MEFNQVLALWEKGSYVPVSDDEHIDAPWCGFPAGTSREVVWSWLEKQHTGFSASDAINGKYNELLRSKLIDLCHSWEPTDTDGHEMVCSSCQMKITIYEKENWDANINEICPVLNHDMFVIYSPNESATQDGAGFWSNDLGWVDIEEATLFTKEETLTFTLPLSLGQDAKWIERCYFQAFDNDICSVCGHIFTEKEEQYIDNEGNNYCSALHCKEIFDAK